MTKAFERSGVEHGMMWRVSPCDSKCKERIELISRSKFLYVMACTILMNPDLQLVSTEAAVRAIVALNSSPLDAIRALICQ